MTKMDKKRKDAENQPTNEQQTEKETTQTANEQTTSTDKTAEEAAAETDKTAPEEQAAKSASCEADEWKDKYMRLSAEFDNYRKRTLKEKMDLVAAGGEDVIKAMLAVVDDMERALAAMQTATDVAAVREGVELIAHKMNDTLRQKGVSEIEAVGLPLDTDLHEAVAKFPAGDEQKGKIIDVVQKGYKLKEKVIRYAKVVVGE